MVPEGLVRVAPQPEKMKERKLTRFSKDPICFHGCQLTAGWEKAAPSDLL